MQLDQAGLVVAKPRLVEARPLFLTIGVIFQSIEERVTATLSYLSYNQANIISPAAKEKAMPTLTKLYTMQEASQHNTKDDCWLVIDGKVYDVSSYLDEHPGGDDVMLKATGKDATDDFEDAGHSEDARKLLQDFCIGELDESSSTIIPELEISSEKEAVEYPRKLMDLTKQYWTVPVAIVGISVVVGFLYLYKK